MSTERSFRITGMHCPACEHLVAAEVATDPEVVSARARRADDRLWVEVTGEASPEALRTRWTSLLDPLGYRVWLEDENPSRQLARETLGGVALGLVVLAAFAALQLSGLVTLFAPTNLEVGGAFVLGILASVSSCFALVGGLLLSYTALLGRRHPAAVGPGLAAFHGARVLSFLVGGGILGWVGASLAAGFDLQRVLLSLAAAIMTLLGLSLLGVRVPGLGGAMAVRGAKGLVASARGSGSGIAAGAVLGALTFFLPCGFTQSVQFQALAAGGFWPGAALTSAFAFGTLPVLLSVSWWLGRGLAGSHRAVLLKAGGTIVLGLGLAQLWGAVHLWGWNL